MARKKNLIITEKALKMTKFHENIADYIENHRKKCPKDVFCVAIDGGSASGKTTLCAYLENRLGAQIIHCDDFFIPISEREKRDLRLGNLDFERFEGDVLQKLGSEFSYRPFNCKTQALSDEIFVKKTDIVIVEGAYSHHPLIRKYFDLTIFLKISKDAQKKRVVARAPEKADMFFAKWIPMEQAYFEKYAIIENADLVVDIDERT